MGSAFHVGLPMFSVAIEDIGGVLSLSASSLIPGTGRQVPGGFRKMPLLGGATVALASLCASFRGIAGEFAGDASNFGEFDVASLVGGSGFRLERDGRNIKLSAGGDGSREFGSESVIVLEVLLALGNELARQSTDSALVRSWWQVSEASELLAMQEDDWCSPQSLSQARREAAWYASRLGVTAEAFETAAIWLRARQILFATGQQKDEPSWEDYAGLSAITLPCPDEVAQIAEKAAEILGQTAEEFLVESLADRSNAVRQIVVFRRWYGEPELISNPGA